VKEEIDVEDGIFVFDVEDDGDRFIRIESSLGRIHGDDSDALFVCSTSEHDERTGDQVNDKDQFFYGSKTSFLSIRLDVCL